MPASRHISLILCVVGFSSVICKTIFLELNTPTLEEISFLKKYGYMQDDSEYAPTYTAEAAAEAIEKMQRYAGLTPTGVIDSQTKKLFKKKRCGVKDIDNTSGSSRSRRYIIQQGWDKKTITYRVLNGSSTLGKSRVEELMAQGLAVWAPHGGLQFSHKESGEADIMVFFASGEHGDGFPFDGIGRVVAHAFPPPHGAMHFDDDEVWGDNDESSIEEDEDVTNFFAVAVHEIGHALGLSHSNVKASVMYPYYQVPVETLHMDDILGMQELYLKKKPHSGDETTDSAISGAPRFTLATSSGSDELEENYMPDLCMTNYDTLQVINGKIYVFEEEWVWVLKDRNVMEEGYPQPFHDVFRGLPARISTVRTIYERFNGNVLIFSGRTYWEFAPSDVGFRLVHRGKISIYSLPSYVSELTTVFISNYNNKTYLIAEEQFWRYDEGARKMDKGYPKEMSAWRQVPYPVDAAIIWKGDTYFFQGPRFWRFDNRLIAAHQYYPLPVAQIWFNCPITTDMNKYLTNDGPTFILAALQGLQKQVDVIARTQDIMEMQSRRKILLFHGLPEDKSEDPAAIVAKTIVEKLKVADFSSSGISRCHRMGRTTSPDKPRPILVKFRDLPLRNKIWGTKASLKATGITLSEFLTKSRHDVFMVARQRFGVKKTWTRDGSVYVLGSDGVRHRVTCLAELDKIDEPSARREAPVVKEVTTAATRSRRTNASSRR